jgi:hypothetical protein
VRKVFPRVFLLSQKQEKLVADMIAKLRQGSKLFAFCADCVIIMQQMITE